MQAGVHQAVGLLSEGEGLGGFEGSRPLRLLCIRGTNDQMTAGRKRGPRGLA